MPKIKLNWMYVALAVIGVYFGVLGYFVDLSEIAYFLLTKDLNNIGDFLAGTFAFPAFVLLAAAVLIQSKELSLQRQELTENRTVMMDQASAAKQQARFLGNQIEAMEKQNNLASQVAIADHKSRLFEKRMAVYEAMMDVGFAVFTEAAVSSETNNKVARAHQMSRWFFDDNVAKWTQEIYSTGSEALSGERKIRRELRVRQDKPERWSDERELELDALRERTRALTERFEAALEPLQIDKYLGDFLRISPTIEPYEQAIRSAEQQHNNAK